MLKVTDVSDGWAKSHFTFFYSKEEGLKGGPAHWEQKALEDLAPVGGSNPYIESFKNREAGQIYHLKSTGEEKEVAYYQ